MRQQKLKSFVNRDYTQPHKQITTTHSLAHTHSQKKSPCAPPTPRWSQPSCFFARPLSFWAKPTVPYRWYTWMRAVSCAPMKVGQKREKEARENGSGISCVLFPASDQSSFTRTPSATSLPPPATNRHCWPLLVRAPYLPISSKITHPNFFAVCHAGDDGCLSITGLERFEVLQSHSRSSFSESSLGSVRWLPQSEGIVWVCKGCQIVDNVVCLNFAACIL